MVFTKDEITELIKKAGGYFILGILIYSNFNSHQIQISNNSAGIKKNQETQIKPKDAEKDMQIINGKLENLNTKIENVAEDIKELKALKNMSN